MTEQAESTTESAAVEETASSAEASNSAATSAETENTEAQETQEKPRTVPYERFKEINDKRKTTEEALARAEEKLRGFEKKSKPKPKPAALDSPPEGLSEREQIDWYIRNGSERHFSDIFESKFGISVEDAKTLLSASKSMQEAHVEREWADMCKPHGLDPKDKNIRKLVGGLLKAGENMEESMNLVVSLVAAKGKKGVAEAAKTVVEMETESVSDTMTKEQVFAKNAKQARELAEAGKTVKHENVHEIFERTDRERSK